MSTLSVHAQVNLEHPDIPNVMLGTITYRFSTEVSQEVSDKITYSSIVIQVPATSTVPISEKLKISSPFWHSFLVTFAKVIKEKYDVVYDYTFGQDAALSKDFKLSSVEFKFNIRRENVDKAVKLIEKISLYSTITIMKYSDSSAQYSFNMTMYVDDDTQFNSSAYVNQFMSYVKQIGLL